MATYTNVNVLIAGAGDDYITGTDGDDDLRGSQGNDFIIGGAGNDFLRGGAGNDTLWGGIGDDRMEGAGGNDDLRGGKGNDKLYGGAGRDTLSGDVGADTLYGGADADLFYFTKNSAATGIDTIADFAVGDLIHFDGYGAKSTLMFTVTGSSVNIFVDLQGDGVADYQAAVVLNASLEDVMDATSFGGLTI